MISLEVYKLIHYAGMFFIFSGLGGVLFTHLNGGSLKGKIKMIAFSTHGLGMLLSIIGGFGMLARLGITQGLPGWIYLKLGIWLFMGLAIALAKRKAGFITLLVITIVALAAPWAALNKPF